MTNISDYIIKLLAYRHICPAEPWILHISCHLNKRFSPMVWCFINTAADFLQKKSQRQQDVCPSTGSQSWREGNNLTLYFIGLTSRQTLSRCAVLAVSLTPVCLNISSAAYTPVSLSELLLSLRGKAQERTGEHSGTFKQRLQRNMTFKNLMHITDLSNQRKWI